MSKSLVTVNASELPVEVLTKVNDFISGKLKAYGVNIEPHFGDGTFSKTVSLAQDRAGIEAKKEVRREQFQRVQAIFVLENINQLILALLLAEGWEPRFGGTSGKNGDVATMKFVNVAAREKMDVVSKKVSEMRGEKETAEKLALKDAAIAGARKKIVDLYGEDVAVTVFDTVSHE